MAETKTKAMFNGELLDGMEVPIAETSERWSEYKLEDGATLKVKHVVSSVVRLNNKYEPDGSPIYVAKGNNVAAVASVPDRLRRQN